MQIDHVSFVYKKSGMVHSRALPGRQDTALVIWKCYNLYTKLHVNSRVIKITVFKFGDVPHFFIFIVDDKLYSAISMSARFDVFFHWTVYKSSGQEVQALLLFCEHVMSQVTWSVCPGKKLLLTYCTAFEHINHQNSAQ